MMTKITKAVIACAGWSTRFLPTVKSYAKHLVPILDKPQIQYTVEMLIAAGITDVLIVHRQGEETIKHFFEVDPTLENYLTLTGKQKYLDGWHQMMAKVKVSFLVQPANLPYGTGAPILAARSFIGSDSFVYVFGDDLIIEPHSGEFLDHMITAFGQYSAIAVNACQSVTATEVIRLSSVKYKLGSIPHQVEAIIEKPPTDNIPSLIASVSPFVLSAEIIPLIEKTPLSPTHHELFLTDTISAAAQTHIVIGLPIDTGHWATTGDPLNWLKVNFELATLAKLI